MVNLEQKERLKKAGFCFEEPAFIPTDIMGNPFEVPDKMPTEKDLMRFLNEHRGKLELSEIFPTATCGWGVVLYKPESIKAGDYESSKMQITNADLTEALVRAVEAVLKGAK